MNIPCFLIPVIVGLISAILGYLLGKMSSRGSNSGNVNLQGDLDTCRDNTLKLNTTISSLQADLDSLKLKASSSIESFVADTSIPFDASLALSVYGKKIKKDDLKIVEGIGPKIEELYHNAGIKTWKALSETSLEKSQQILDNAGDRYTMHNPGTWARQSLLAYQGKWKELKDWQNNLDGGKE